MNLVNETPLPVLLLRNAEKGDSVAALLVGCSTYSIRENGLAISERQRSLTVMSSDSIPGDAHFGKSGVSVCATGHVYPANGEAQSADASLWVGDAEHQVRAFGARVWQEPIFGGELVPTAPKPFRRVAMTWENAFGGRVARPPSVKILDGEESIVPPHDQSFPLNRDGTGFYPERELALMQSLPRLEDPHNPIKSWSDRPEPVCYAPYSLAGGMRAFAMLRDGRLDYARAGQLFSRAAPRTSFSMVPPGTIIKLTGMRPAGGVLAFNVPEPPFLARIEIGSRSAPISLQVDAVDIDAEAAEVRIAYRATFRYGLVQFETREVRVKPSGALGAASAANAVNL